MGDLGYRAEEGEEHDRDGAPAATGDAFGMFAPDAALYRGV